MTHDDMKRIAGAHDSKAAKIRALHDGGATTTAISTFLGIRYQHTYNVLLRAGQIRKEAPVEQPQVLPVEVNPDGSLVLPPEMLAPLGVMEGGQVFARQTPDGLLLMSRDNAIAELQRVIDKQAPGHAPFLAALLHQPSGLNGKPEG